MCIWYHNICVAECELHDGIIPVPHTSNVFHATANIASQLNFYKNTIILLHFSYKYHQKKTFSSQQLPVIMIPQYLTHSSKSTMATILCFIVIGISDCPVCIPSQQFQSIMLLKPLLHIGYLYDTRGSIPCIIISMALP